MKSLTIEIGVADYDLETIGFHLHVLQPDTGRPKSSGFLRMTPSELEAFILAMKASPAGIALRVPEGGIKPRPAPQRDGDPPRRAAAEEPAGVRSRQATGGQDGDFSHAEPAMPDAFPAQGYDDRPDEAHAGRSPGQLSAEEPVRRRDNRRSWNPDQRTSGAFPDRLGKLSDDWSRPAGPADSKITA